MSIVFDVSGKDMHKEVCTRNSVANVHTTRVTSQVDVCFNGLQFVASSRSGKNILTRAPASTHCYLPTGQPEDCNQITISPRRYPLIPWLPCSKSSDYSDDN
jgi:hypothetical protein